MLLKISCESLIILLKLLYAVFYEVSQFRLVFFCWQLFYVRFKLCDFLGVSFPVEIHFELSGSVFGQPVLISKIHQVL